MGISLKPEHLKRYKDITWLFMKYGRSDLVKQAGLDELLKDEDGPAAEVRPGQSRRPRRPTSRRWARPSSSWPSCSRPAPTFSRSLIWMRSRASRTTSGLSPSRKSKRIVSDELGVRISKAFAEFERSRSPRPRWARCTAPRCATAARSSSRSSGPASAKSMVEDLEVLKEIAARSRQSHARWASATSSGACSRSCARALLRELDYRQEAQQPHDLAENLKDFEAIVVPLPGRGLHDLARADDGLRRRHKRSPRSPARADRHRRVALAEQLFRAYLQADSRRRLLPRRPASRQRLPDRRRPDRAARSGHGGPHRRRARRRTPAAAAGDQRGARR